MDGCKRQNALDISTLVMMGVAVNRRIDIGTVSTISVPVLLLVAQNGAGSPRTHGRNTIRFTKRLAKSLHDADKDVNLIVYPSFGYDGHTLFFKLQKQYWSDVIEFLRNHL